MYTVILPLSAHLCIDMHRRKRDYNQQNIGSILESHGVSLDLIIPKKQKRTSESKESGETQQQKTGSREFTCVCTYVCDLVLNAQMCTNDYCVCVRVCVCVCVF